MQNKDLTRGNRRDKRQRAIEHAFDVYWNKWGRYDDTFKKSYSCIYRIAGVNYRYSREILNSTEEKWLYEDEHRQEVLDSVLSVYKHLRNCSCFLCKGHKKYEKTVHQLREEFRDKDELDFLDDV